MYTYVYTFSDGNKITEDQPAIEQKLNNGVIKDLKQVTERHCYKLVRYVNKDDDAMIR